jgi:hypothetical protein
MSATFVIGLGFQQAEPVEQYEMVPELEVKLLSPEE